MRAELAKRVRRMETRIGPASPADLSLGQRLFMLVLAYDRGGLQEHEAIMAGFARALGYQGREGFRLFKDDVQHKPSRISERHRMAIDAFFAAHGLDPEDEADVDAKLALIGRRLDAMPACLPARIVGSALEVESADTPA